MLASELKSPYPNCPLCHLLAEPVASSKDRDTQPSCQGSG